MANMSKNTLRKQESGTMGEHLSFLRRMAVSPRSVGAIGPSGPVLARAMASQIDFSISGPVLELGPGPGSITNAILEQMHAHDRPSSDLTAIERDPVFVKIMSERFSDIHVVDGDAFDFINELASRNLPPFAAIVSGLPLLNFPPEQRKALLQNIMNSLAPNAPFIQFSYGWKNPVGPMPGVKAMHTAFVLKNFPPAHVWVYRRQQ